MVRHASHGSHASNHSGISLTAMPCRGSGFENAENLEVSSMWLSKLCFDSSHTSFVFVHSSLNWHRMPYATCSRSTSANMAGLRTLVEKASSAVLLGIDMHWLKSLRTAKLYPSTMKAPSSAIVTKQSRKSEKMWIHRIRETWLRILMSFPLHFLSEQCGRAADFSSCTGEKKSQACTPLVVW